VLGHGRLSPATDAASRLARLEELTRAALRGEPMSEPAFAAFQRVVRRRAIPDRYPLDLLEGFRMDVEGVRYRHLDDTLNYSYHVAGVVGLMMALVMGVPADDADTLDRACDLGLAFQLTNIARDVLDDWARGRVYLPESWLQEAGVPLEALAEPRYRPQLHEVACKLVAAADGYYASSGFGMSRLPLRSAMAVGAARAVYSGIGSRLLILGPAAWDRRIVIPQRRKLALIIGGTVAGALAAARAARPADRNGLWRRPWRDGSSNAGGAGANGGWIVSPLGDRADASHPPLTARAAPREASRPAARKESRTTPHLLSRGRRGGDDALL
jgi:phytoene synthase